MAGFAPPKQFRGSGDLRALLESNWRYLATYLNNLGSGASCAIQKSGNQTLTANTTPQDVTFESVMWDSGGMADLANNAIDVRSDGLFLVTVDIIFTGTAPGTNGYFVVRRNGSATTSVIIRQDATNWYAASGHTQTTQLQLSEGDSVSVAVHPGGNAATLRGDGDQVGCKLIVTKL